MSHIVLVILLLLLNGGHESFWNVESCRCMQLQNCCLLSNPSFLRIPAKSRFRLCPCESLHSFQRVAFIFEQLSHPPTWHHTKLHQAVPALVPMSHSCLIGSCIFLQQWVNLEWKIPLKKASVPDSYSAHHGMAQTLKPTGLHLEHQMTFHGWTGHKEKKERRMGKGKSGIIK